MRVYEVSNDDRLAFPRTITAGASPHIWPRIARTARIALAGQGNTKKRKNGSIDWYAYVSVDGTSREE